MQKQFVVWFAMAALAGCQSALVEYNGREFDDEPTITLKEYVDDLREEAVWTPSPEQLEDWDGSFPLASLALLRSATTVRIRREFRIIYDDERYVSFRADMRDNYGGSGNQYSVYVGTIDRTSGRVLGVRDFVPKGKWPALRQKLYDGAVKKLGGEEYIQDKVEVIENFYFAKDGLHFIYNPYEIACGAAGDIEVVVDLKTL